VQKHRHEEKFNLYFKKISPSPRSFVFASLTQTFVLKESLMCISKNSVKKLFPFLHVIHISISLSLSHYLYLSILSISISFSLYLTRTPRHAHTHTHRYTQPSSLILFAFSFPRFPSNVRYIRIPKTC